MAVELLAESVTHGRCQSYGLYQPRPKTNKVGQTDNSWGEQNSPPGKMELKGTPRKVAERTLVCCHIKEMNESVRLATV